MEKKIVTNEDYEWLKGQFIVDRFLRFEIDKHEVFIGLTSNKKRMILSYIVLVDGKIQTSEEQWVHIKETSKFSKKYIKKFEEKKKTTKMIKNKYWGYIEIPKLKIYYGFYSLNDQKNQIKNGIEVMSGSSLPSINGSNIVLVAHSGIAYNILFDRLDVLGIEDEVNLYFNNIKYIYKVKRILKKDKKDILSTIKNNKNTLILITCDKKEKDKNLIVYLELI